MLRTYAGVGIVLSDEQLEQYRRMTPGERLALSLRMIDENWKYLMHGAKEHVDRKFELLNRLNDERTRNILNGLARAATRHEPR